MVRKYIICIVSMLLSAVGAAYGQDVADEVIVDESCFGLDYEDEVGNFDFLYTGGETFDYDELMIGNLIEEALSHLGTRYVYGSKGPNSFDCSGFTSYVFKRQNNVNIGASSREQYARNTPITRDQLQQGDLVFFTSPRSGRQVGHVGIVVDVDPVSGTFSFIHASTHEGVKISKSTDGYYERRYVGARRVE